MDCNGSGSVSKINTMIGLANQFDPTLKGDQWNIGPGDGDQAEGQIQGDPAIVPAKLAQADVAAYQNAKPQQDQPKEKTASTGEPSSTDVPATFKPSKSIHPEGNLDPLRKTHKNGSQMALVTFGLDLKSRRKSQKTRPSMINAAICGGMGW